MAKKPTGLNKKVSSIFAGIPNPDEQPDEPLRPGPSTQAHTAAVKEKADGVETRLRNAWKYTTETFRFGARPRLTFDIGTSRLKAVLYTKRSGRWAIEGAAEHSFDADEQGIRKRDATDMINGIQAIAGKLDPLRQAQAGLVIEGPEVFLTVMTAPSEPKKQWRDAIAWQAADMTLFPLDEAEMQWYVYPDHSGSILENRVLVSAAQNSKLDEIISWFEKAGVRLEVVVPAPLAIEHFIKRYERPLGTASLVMDIGAESTRLYFFYSGRFLCMRQFAFGSDTMYRSLVGTIQVEQERININFAEAATLIQKYDLLSGVQHLDPEQPKKSQLAARLRPFMEKLTGEIQRSLAYYQSEYKTEAVERIFITGGGGSTEGLGKFLENELGLTVTLLNAAEDFSIPIAHTVTRNTPSLSFAFAPALGLAVMDTKPINFARWQDRLSPRAARSKRIFRVGLAAACACLALTMFVLGATSARVSREKADVDRQLNEAGIQRQRLEELETLTTAIQNRKDMLERIMGVEPLWGGALRELSRIIPREVTLENLEVNENKTAKELKLDGYVRTLDTSSDVVVSDLLNALNESPYFVSASLLSRSQTETDENIQDVFSISVELL